MRVATKIAVQVSGSPEGSECCPTAASTTVTLSFYWARQTVGSFIFSAALDVKLREAQLTDRTKKVRFFAPHAPRRPICAHAKTCQCGACGS